MALAGQPHIAALRHSEQELTLDWSDGRQSRFAAIWLLDNRPDGRHGPLGQRLFDIAELPEEPRIAAAALTEGGDVMVTLAPANVALTYAAGWLREHALDPASRAERCHPPQFWDKSLAQRLPTASYRDVAANDRAEPELGELRGRESLRGEVGEADGGGDVEERCIGHVAIRVALSPGNGEGFLVGHAKIISDTSIRPL